MHYTMPSTVLPMNNLLSCRYFVMYCKLPKICGTLLFYTLLEGKGGEGRYTTMVDWIMEWINFALGWTVNSYSVLKLLFKKDFECWIAQ